MLLGVFPFTLIRIMLSYTHSIHPCASTQAHILFHRGCYIYTFIHTDIDLHYYTQNCTASQMGVCTYRITVTHTCTQLYTETQTRTHS